MLISPMLKSQIEEEDPAVGTEKEVLGKHKGNQVNVVSRQKRRRKGWRMELSSMLNVSERS